MADFLASLKKTTGRALKAVFGTAHERTMKRLRPLVSTINDLEPRFRCLSDAELEAKTPELKQKLENGASLDDILPEAFAAVREASLRTTGLRHYDVQLVGGISLHEGKVAEMKTGEGKTLVATLPLYLNALEGKGCHLVTVNDYLAKRDAEWMGQIYGFLGLSTGTIEHGQGTAEKKRAYNCDITYGQNNEFGFDYLRDNMRFSIYEYVQRDLHYAIVDEADSILVDEARTPLIISGAAEESAALYMTVNEAIPRIRRDIHFNVDEERRTVTLTDEGVDAVEKLLSVGNLYDPSNIEYLHHVNQALKAHYCYKKDVNYAVKDGEIIIIDEFTGRLMPGRRWSDGLHQAVEAKEHVRVQEENRTMATISFQNLFRLYGKLAGMTGTADTEAQEFNKTYKLDVVVIPTNRPCIRHDFEDVIYRSYAEKRTALLEEILDCQERGQPVLVGTVSVEKSEDLSRVLKRKGIVHSVLNAKHHEREAYIVAQAGRRGSVTVATNMAGRGTDILLGGNPEMLAKAAHEEDEEQDFQELVAQFREQCAREREEVLRAGGLHILGTERHESRRIDNQLRGRAGRQGDPGSSRFYLSLEDDLMRIFAGDRVGMIMDRLGMPEGEPIEHRMVTKSVERAQGKVEARNFDIRKNLLEYDDVMNQQRKTVYTLRRQFLEGRYQTVAITDDEEIKKRVEGGAKRIEVAPPPDARAPPHPRRWMLALGRPRKDDEGRSVEVSRVSDLESFEAEALERTVYEQFGVRLPLQGLADRPEEAYELCCHDCAQALSEQRERLLDMTDEQVERIVSEHCGQGGNAAWDVEALAEAARKTFDVWVEVEDLQKLQAAEEVARRVYDEVEWVIKIRDGELGSAQVEEIVDLALADCCGPGLEVAAWKLDELRASLEERLGVEMDGLAEDVQELCAAGSSGEPGGEGSPYRGAGAPAGPEPREVRRGLRDRIARRYFGALEDKARYVRIRDERSKEPHPAEGLVKDLVEEHCPKGKPSDEWDLAALARELEEETTAPVQRLDLETVQRDAHRSLARSVTRAAEEREVEILGKIVGTFCKGNDPEAWNRVGLAEEIEKHIGVRPGAADTAETRNEMVEGVFREVQAAHQREVVEPLVERIEARCPLGQPVEKWALRQLREDFQEEKLKLKDIEKLDLRAYVSMRLLRYVERMIRARAHVLSPDAHLHAFRQLFLTEVDKQWIDHLQNMESLRQGIGLTSYGQRDPKREYQREGYSMFRALIADTQANVIEKLFHVVFRSEEDAARLGRRRVRRTEEGRGGDQTVRRGTVRRAQPKVGRNDPCPCGSGKKYKKCCMVKDQPAA